MTETAFLFAYFTIAGLYFHCRQLRQPHTEPSQIAPAAVAEAAATPADAASAAFRHAAPNFSFSAIPLRHDITAFYVLIFQHFFADDTRLHFHFIRLRRNRLRHIIYAMPYLSPCCLQDALQALNAMAPPDYAAAGILPRQATRQTQRRCFRRRYFAFAVPAAAAA
jgi:hypothetical protein